MQVQKISNQNNQSSFGATIKHCKKFQILEKQAYLSGMEGVIPECEKFLAENFPNHRLKLQNEGIKNLTTKKYHKFPGERDREASLFENFLYFIDIIYKPTKESYQKFIKELFE